MHGGMFKLRFDWYISHGCSISFLAGNLSDREPSEQVVFLCIWKALCFCDLDLISGPSPSVSLVVLHCRDVLLVVVLVLGNFLTFPITFSNIHALLCLVFKRMLMSTTVQVVVLKGWETVICFHTSFFRAWVQRVQIICCLLTLCGEKLFWGRRGFAFVGMKCASGSWLDSVMSSQRSGMVISFRMPVLDNGTTFPGPSDPIRSSHSKWSFLYSMFEIALTFSSSHLLVEGMLEGLLMLHGLQVSHQKTTLQLPFPAQSRCYCRHLSGFFICDLIEAAFRSQAPLPPCGSEKSMRRTWRRLVISLASSHWLVITFLTGHLYFPRMHLACREVYLERFLSEFWMWSQQYRTLPGCSQR